LFGGENWEERDFKMFKSLEIIFCLLLLFSCTGKADKKTSENNSSVPSFVKLEEKFDTECLISFKSEFVMEDGSEVDGYYNNRSLFIEPYTSYALNDDTLHVTTLYEVNSCAETVGRIRFSNDSLFLFVEQMGNVACTSIEFRKFDYVIVRKNIKKCIVVF
jgi:hypothetical protein